MLNLEQYLMCKVSEENSEVSKVAMKAQQHSLATPTLPKALITSPH